MTKSKNTKRALLASVLSVVVCAAMLVGSTFAWFTDSVTSGKNKIVAGNLDIELNYKNASQPEWATVEGSNKLFVNTSGEDMKWEPGAASVVYLQLKNVGNLALKYLLSVNAQDVVTGEDGAALSKVLKTAVVEIAETDVNTYTRATAIEKATAADAASVLTYSKSGEMTEQNETKYFAMIVYFPSEIGNTHDGKVYNRNDVTLETDLYLNLAATQTPHEEDSFGSDYDKDVLPPYQETVKVEIGAGNTIDKPITLGAADAGEVSEDAPVSVTVPAEVVLKPDTTDFSLSIKPAAKDPDVVVNSVSDAIAYDIKMPLDTSNTVPVPVTLFIGKGLNLTGVYHNDVLMTDADTQAKNTYQYDPATGVITMYITNCSTFTFIFGPDFAVSNFAEFQNALAQAQNGDTIALTAVINPTTNFTFNKSIVIDMNGYGFVRAKETSGGYGIKLLPGCDLTMKNGKWDMAGTFGDISAVGKDGACNVTYENVTFTNLDNPTKEELAQRPGNSSNLVKTAFKANMQGNLTVNATFKDCTFNNAAVEFSGFNDGNTYTAEFSHCTFNNIGNAGAIVAKSYGMTNDCKVTVSDCIFNITVTSNVEAIESESRVTLNLTNNTVNGSVADRDYYVVFDTTSLKFYEYGKVTESGTTLKGIATMN